MTNESTVQLISNQFIELFVSNGKHGWGLVSQRFMFLGTSCCYWWNMTEHTASFLYTQGETRISGGISLCPEAVCFPTHYQKMKEKSTLSKNVREFSSLSSNIVDDTQSTMAKDLTWVLVIIPALSLAYLCNLGLNKALWNTICTNRHLKSYFHPYG